MQALAHLVQEVLGRPNFRGADGGDVHDCVQDVQVTMEIATWMGLGLGVRGWLDFPWFTMI
jgi:hypothetical protein